MQMLDVQFSDLTQADCLEAMLAGDQRYDGIFITAVLTTGIYCRPSCSARKPKPENVTFYPDCHTAELNGFRACKRCQPKQRVYEVEIVETVCGLIDQHHEENPSIKWLADEVGLSTSQLHRIFKRILGITAKQYMDTQRLENFTQQLKDGVSIADAGYQAGYGSSSRIYENVPKQIGMTPAEYKQGGQGLQIWYTITDSPLGRMLVATTERGVCGISLSDQDDDLTDFIAQEYPEANLVYDDTELSEYVQEILAHLSGQRPHLDLPIDIQVTAFQRLVLDALQKIPYGETRSYSDIAESIGKPTSIRAVANACGANPVPLVIPCHRVTRKNGVSGGYRWGTERKEALLHLEQEYSTKASQVE